MENLSDKAHDAANMFREVASELRDVGKAAVKGVFERIDVNMDDRLDVWPKDE